MKPAVAYYRVSTDRQGRSGLGLDAQEDAIKRFAASEGYSVTATYREIDSGNQDQRPELAAALARCRKDRATLIIAKIDRLSRRVSFIANLMDSHADFRVVDIPGADRFQLHLMAAFAEYEREQISKRTKAALAAAKERGTLLGQHGREVLSRQNAAAAVEFAQRMQPTIEQLQQAGFKTVRALRDEMNRQQIPTYRPGKQWHETSVHNLLKRIKLLS